MKAGGGGILVVRGGAIGDFILTLPVLAALRAQFPKARLEVVGYPHIVQLAHDGGLVDEVRPIESRALAGFFARDGQLDPDWAGYFGNFSVILSFLYDPDCLFQANVGRCSTAQFIAGPHRPDENANRHATEVFLKPLERLAIFDADPIPRLNIPPSPEPPLGSGDWLALHPGSGSERKNWPEANWQRFMEKLMATTGLNLLLVGGEAEGDRMNRLAASLPLARVQLARSLPLSALAARLKLCRGFVGHDSGISHLAAALGVSSIVLWGPTADAVWRPRGDHIAILGLDGGLGRLSVDHAVDQARRRFGAA